MMNHRKNNYQQHIQKQTHKEKDEYHLIITNNQQLEERNMKKTSEKATKANEQNFC